MTKEELKKEAEEYVGSKSCDTDDYSCRFLPSTVEEMLIEFAEPREKRIAELERNVAYYAERAKHAELNGRDIVLENKSLGERCLQLQKDKGNLTDRVRELEQQIEQAKKNKVVEHFEAYGQCRDSRRIAELEAQLESERDLPAIAYMQGAEKQKKKDEEELKKWKDEWQEQVQKATDEGYARTLQTIQLSKVKEIMQKLIANAPDTYSGTNIELQQKKMFTFQDAVNKAEQFLKRN